VGIKRAAVKEGRPESQNGPEIERFQARILLDSWLALAGE
jgi:hypothetical protein